MTVQASSLDSGTLCDICRDVPVLDLLRHGGKTNDLGLLDEIIDRTCCPLCRLVTESFRHQRDSRLAISGARCFLSPCSQESQVTKRKQFFLGITVAAAFDDRAINEASKYLDGRKWMVRDPVREWKSSLHVVAEDAALLGPSWHTTDNARVFSPYIDVSLVHGWIENCQTTHARLTTPAPRWAPILSPTVPGFKLLDIHNMCLTTAYLGERYFALSYVWGTEPFFTTLRSNYRILSAPGSLSQLYEKLPGVLQSTVELMVKLKERFLWVDSLCIIQDDDDDVNINVQRMVI
jgi:hypothetical protein